MAENGSTRGGRSFDQLCQGPPAAYCLDNLVDIRRPLELKEVKDKIVRKIRDVIDSLEIGRGQRVAKIYIGKTFIRRQKTRGGHRQDLDPMNSNTWKLNGISQRWDHHQDATYGEKKEKYGKDGMVVLAAVTKEAMPQRCRIKLEDYALAIEQCLLHHFLIDIGDERVVNDTFDPGRVDGGKSIAYAIYMAFAFEEAAPQQPALAHPN